MKKFKRKGISLVALIITIIVLIIITSTVIINISHSNLFSIAKKAVDDYNKANLKDEAILNMLSPNEVKSKITSDINSATEAKGIKTDFAGLTTIALHLENANGPGEYYNVYEQNGIIYGIYKDDNNEYYDMQYSNGSLTLNKKEILNVNDIGIYGDGKTDYSSAISKAIGKYANQYILYFPSGTYIINNVYARADNTFLLGDNSTTFDVTKSFLFDSVSNLILSNINFVRNSEYILSDLPDNTLLLHFHTKYSESKNISIANCTFSDSNYGIKFNTYSGTGYGFDNIVLKNVKVNNCVNPIYMNSVRNSLAIDVTLNQTKAYANATQLHHSLYLSYDCDNLTYRRLVIDGGYDKSIVDNPADIQAYAESSKTMGSILFDGISFVNRTGNYSRLLSTGTCEEIILKNVMLDAPSTIYEGLISNYSSNLIIQDSTFNCKALKFLNNKAATTTVTNCTFSLYNKPENSTTFDNRSGRLIFKNSTLNIIDPATPFRLLQIFNDNSYTEFTNNKLNIISTDKTLYQNSGSCAIVFINWNTNKIGTLNVSNNIINANNNISSSILVATDATNYTINFTNNKLYGFDKIFSYKSSTGNENFDVTGTELMK